MANIGITASATNFMNYPAWIKAGGAEVVELSYASDAALIDSCDGFLLSGGIDIHPSFYGSETDIYPHATSFDLKRDTFEMEIFNFARKNQKPVLAICRGLQLVNAFLGGDLIQDLEFSGYENHRKDTDGDRIHRIQIVSGSMLQVISQTSEGIVNSAHHQGLGKIAAELRVVAWSTDQVAEAIEYKNSEGQAFFLGVQWHPERFRESAYIETFSNNIRRAFLEAAERNK